LVGEVVLENMSLIAKTANLALPQLTPMFVSHLLSLGLVESGPEDSSMKDDYEILAADIAVLQAIKKASRGPIPARVEKYTLRLSGLGLELWAAASGSRGRERRPRSSPCRHGAKSRPTWRSTGSSTCRCHSWPLSSATPRNSLRYRCSIGRSSTWVSGP